MHTWQPPETRSDLYHRGRQASPVGSLFSWTVVWGPEEGTIARQRQAELPRALYACRIHLFVVARGLPRCPPPQWSCQLTAAHPHPVMSTWGSPQLSHSLSHLRLVSHR